MSLVRRAWHRLRSLFDPHGLDQDFDDEARTHLELAVDEYVQRGLPMAEAQRLAREKFGSLAASKDAHRDSRGLPWLERFVFDARLALRALRRDWTFTVAAVAMLAIAIGLNVTVFAIMDTMLFRGYPLVHREGRLVMLQEAYQAGTPAPGQMSYPDFEEWRAQAKTFGAMAFVGAASISLRDGDGRPLDTRTFLVSANLFGLLGVPPMLGRDFTATDEVTPTPQVAILNHRFWVSRFGQRADIVGLRILVNGAPVTIVGVMPQRFDFPYKQDLWMPISRTPALLARETTTWGFITAGRMRDGVSMQEARGELESISRRLEAAYPATNRGLVPTSASHIEMNSGPDARLIWGSLWIAAWFVLLIACANLANLTLVRTVGRWREFSTKIALGAGQARMIRQVLLENVTLAMVAGGLGWWITTASVGRWETVTASQYQVLDFAVDSRTFAYLAAIAVAAAALLSAAPIFRIAQLGTSRALKGDARGATQGLRGKHLAAGLVTAQMALAIVLLSGTGVLGRSFSNIVNANTGVHDPGNVLVGMVRLPSDKYPTAEARRIYATALEASLTTIPGAAAGSIASTLPVKHAVPRRFEIEGRPVTLDAADTAAFVSAGPAYFGVLGTAPISGRTFTDADGADAPTVAIVNQAFVDRYWPGEEPLGKRLRVLRRNASGGAWLSVIGIVPNLLQSDPLRQQFKPVAYVPYQQDTAMPWVYFLLRMTAPLEHVAQVTRERVHAVDTDLVLENFGTLQDTYKFDRDFMDAEHSELRKHAVVGTIFAGIALLLAATGLGAVIAHSVTQRTKEIGVRMAIGAAARDISRMIFREGMRPVAMGLLTGLAASLAVNRVLQSQLVGVSPYDPLTMASAPVVLVAVALLACQIPARRAVQVDPVIALRHE